jgi:putative MATE family efflux protein
VLITGFFLNLILDPWFIFGGGGLPAMGIAGIALATVLVQLGGGLYLGWRVYRSGMIRGEDLRHLFPKPAVFKEIARQGVPASVNMMTIGMGIFVITYFVGTFGPEAVAAYGAGMRVEQIVLVSTIGLNVSTLTIVAQNHGAGRVDRIHEVLKRSLIYGAVFMGVGAVVVLLAAEFCMNVFTKDARVVAIGTGYLRVDALVFYAYVILFVHVAALQGMKRPVYPVLIGLTRQIFAPWVVFFVCVQILDLGIASIWWGIFGVTWGAALITLYYTRRTLRKSATSSDADKKSGIS